MLTVLCTEKTFKLEKCKIQASVKYKQIQGLIFSTLLNIHNTVINA